MILVFYSWYIHHNLEQFFSQNNLEMLKKMTAFFQIFVPAIPARTMDAACLICKDMCVYAVEDILAKIANLVRNILIQLEIMCRHFLSSRLCLLMACKLFCVVQLGTYRLWHKTKTRTIISNILFFSIKLHSWEEIYFPMAAIFKLYKNIRYFAEQCKLYSQTRWYRGFYGSVY